MNFTLETTFQASVLFEQSIAVGGFSYLLIYGEHVNGYFCCVPSRHWGCEMAEPTNIAYNRDKLIECGASETIAASLAEAIHFISSTSL